MTNSKPNLKARALHEFARFATMFAYLWAMFLRSSDGGGDEHGEVGICGDSRPIQKYCLSHNWASVAAPKVPWSAGEGPCWWTEPDLQAAASRCGARRPHRTWYGRVLSSAERPMSSRNCNTFSTSLENTQNRSLTLGLRRDSSAGTRTKGMYWGYDSGWGLPVLVLVVVAHVSVLVLASEALVRLSPNAKRKRNLPSVNLSTGTGAGRREIARPNAPYSDRRFGRVRIEPCRPSAEYWPRAKTWACESASVLHGAEVRLGKSAGNLRSYSDDLKSRGR